MHSDPAGIPAYLNFFRDYFGTPYIIFGIVFAALVICSLYVTFRLSNSCRFRSFALFAIMGSSASLWTFVLSSLALCMMMVDQYWSAPALAISRTSEFALLFTLVLIPVSVISLRRRAANRIFPLFFSGSKNYSRSSIIQGSSGVSGNRIAEIFSKISARISDSSISLNLLPVSTRLPASAAMDWNGKKVVAISEDVASGLDDEELETVLAHELGHIEHRDSLQKTVATTYKLAFFFDPLSRFLEAAIYREKELEADEFSAKLTGKPAVLASALIKIYERGKFGSIPGHNVSSPSLSLLSVATMSERRQLFSKEPSISLRIRRLLDLAKRLDE